jgi:glycine/D-amino acid oxidase-like deaminating enzyme
MTRTPRIETLERIFWTDGRAPYAPRPAAMPAHVDVAVIGAGFTGLATAMHLARAGRSVAVLEAQGIGHGASSRNGGLAGPSFHKIGMTGLTARYGPDKAAAIMGEGMRALDHFEAFVADEGIDCGLRMTGRFRGAVTTDDYDATGRECERLSKAVGLPFEMIPRDRQRGEIGSDFYRGGVVYPRDGGLDPHLLLVALAARAEAAGAVLFANTPVTGITRDGPGTLLRHPGGVLRADQTVIATNGYGGAEGGTLSSRVVPILTGAAATAPLTAELMAELTPKGRAFTESRRVFMWFRPTPDGRRFIFGGRIGPMRGDPARRVAAVRAAAVRVFPQLADVAFTHLWTGLVAYTADHAPHSGCVDGVWLAGGYCGSGVTRSLWFARNLALRMQGLPGGESAFDDLPFVPVPLRRLAPLGARALTRWHALRDAAVLARRDRTGG